MIGIHKIDAKRRDESGSFLVAALVIILFLTSIGLVVAQLVSSQYQQVKGRTFFQNAQLAAEAGIEETVNKLNADDSFSGFDSAQQFFDNTIQGKGVFTTTVTTNPDGKSKVIVATGKVYRADGDTNPINTRTVKVTVVGTQSEGYSVYTGPGGLILGGSAKITNSDVYVNGTITLNGASSIGTASQPLKVYAANYVCPTSGGPTYPQVCTTTQPISLAYSTNIYGTVCATNQTSTGPNNNIQGGSTGQGLVLGCTAPQVSTPTYDRQAQINAVTTTKPSSDSDIDCTKWRSADKFARTWSANLKITGNVTIASSCDLTITGNVYITGNLSIGGAASITVADSVGTTRPVVIVDGTITVNGSGQMKANSSGTGIQFISFKSNASCSPSCTNLTGDDLKNSQNYQTVSVGGSAQLPGMIFQSYWGKISLAGSGNMGSAIGQTVDMGGAGTVTFGTKLAAGSRTWTISSYQQVFQ